MRTNLLAMGAALVAVLPATLVAVTFTNDTLITSGNLAYDGQAVVVSGCALTVDGAHAFNSLLLTNGSILTHSSAPAGESANLLNLTIAQGLTVAADSRIEVGGRGYAGGAGTGAGTSSTSKSGGGGGYGGVGATSAAGVPGGSVYGNLLNPTNHGSGGGNGYFSTGGSGGGMIRLSVGGRLQLDGRIAAGGASGSGNGMGGAGSGGSVNITAGSLAGYGGISANGGAATVGGGGAGGRIGVLCTNNLFLGTMTAYGGAGAQYGGAGTVLFKATPAAVGDLRVDNNGNFGQYTPLTTPTPFNLTLGNAACVYPLAPLTNGSVLIQSNGWLTHLPGQTGFDLTVLNDLVIAGGGRLDVSGRGFSTATGSGAGSSSTNGGGGGGSHGGQGGQATAAGGATYDSITAPSLFGSGGGNGYFSSGGNGGGAARLTVAGKLQVDGALKADGNRAEDYVFGGGGAGGSLNLTVGGLAGTGVVSANGGSSPSGGGGGGGRIAVYCTSNAFSGLLTVYGGTGTNVGGAGTIFSKATAAARGQVLVDNGGFAGGMTRLSRALWPTNITFDLIVGNAAQMISENPMVFGDFHVAAGGVVTHDMGQTNLQLTATNDLRIETGGQVTANGLGYGSATGPGVGGSSTQRTGGGGGYGGVGGTGTNGAAGGLAYGSATQPFYLGSGGGQGYLCAGGAGGGFVRLKAGRILQINGTITANGATAANFYGGGGSGGSIVLVGGIVTGTGYVTANGGSSKWGGGGAGGRIAMYGGVLVDMPNPPTVLGGLSNDGLNLPGNGANGTFYSSTNAPPFAAISMVAARETRLQPAVQGSNWCLEAPSVTGQFYQLQTSADLQTWVDEGEPVAGTGAVLNWTLEATRQPQRFARVLVFQ